MRHRYRYLDPALLQAILAGLDLEQLFRQLLLAGSGDVELARAWLKELQEQGYLPASLDLEAFFEALQAQQVVARDEQGALVLTGVGERQVRQSAFEELFTKLERGGPGYHRVPAAGRGVERLPETRPYAFGDELSHLDVGRSLHNALRRTTGSLELREQDLEVHETEHRTACATVIAIDTSHSMVLYGEDRITPARKVALALTELITRKYPKDHLEAVLFGDQAYQIPLDQLPYIEAGPFHTNTRDALRLGRALLSRRKQPNKQIFLITDGKPTAITEGGSVFKNPFGLDLRIVNKTLEEAEQCRRHRVVITTFMIATDPTLTAFVERLSEINRGRAYFAAPHDLGELILADYIRNRRRRVH